MGRDSRTGFCAGDDNGTRQDVIWYMPWRQVGARGWWALSVNRVKDDYFLRVLSKRPQDTRSCGVELRIAVDTGAPSTYRALQMVQVALLQAAQQQAEGNTQAGLVLPLKEMDTVCFYPKLGWAEAIGSINAEGEIRLSLKATVQRGGLEMTLCVHPQDAPAQVYLSLGVLVQALAADARAQEEASWIAAKAAE